MILEGIHSVKYNHSNQQIMEMVRHASTAVVSMFCVYGTGVGVG